MTARLPTVRLVLAALLLCSSGLQASAQGPVPEQPALPVPGMPGTGWQTTDRIVQDANRTGMALYDGPVADAYGMLRDPANEAYAAGMPRPLVVLRDGAGGGPTGPDRLFSFGPPRLFGDAAWAPSPQAARIGQSGYAMGDADDYPLSATGMLLTDAVDLDMAAADGNPLVLQPTVQPVNVQNIAFGALASAGAVYSSMFHDLEPRLTFAMRSNLGQGRDGVAVLVFTAPPTQAPATLAACTGTCAFVPPMPATALFGRPQPPGQPAVGAFNGATGYTGATDWVNQTYNLRPWIGQTVWLGFYFQSMSAPGAGYFDGPAFNASLPFRGFHLDDLLVTAGGAYQNLQVRPIDRPNFVPAGIMPAVPTVTPEDGVQVTTQVRNTGYLQEHLQVLVQLLGPGTNPPPLAQRIVGPVLMPSGAVLPINVTFTDIPAGTAATVSVRVQRLGDDPSTAANEATAAPASAARVALGSNDRGDADPTDDQQTKSVRIQRVHAVVPGPLTRSEGEAGAGRGITFTMPLQNLGNVRDTVRLKATVLDVRDPHDPRVVTGLLSPEEQEQVFDLGVMERVVAQWTLQPGTPGQYQLFVRDELDPPFHPTDLDPQAIRPLQVPYIPAPTILVDGNLGDGAWALAAQMPLAMQNPLNWAPASLLAGNNRPILRAMHDGTNLYLGISGLPGTTASLRVLFDEEGDAQAIDGSEDGILLPAGQDLYYSAAARAFVPDTVTEPGNMALSGNIAEIRRPMRGGAQDLDLQGRYVGLFIEQAVPPVNGITNRLHFPAGAEYIDGGLTPDGTSSHGIPAPDGSLSDEMRQWLPMELVPASSLPPEDLRLPLRVVSTGVGLERGAPPLFVEDLDGCQLQRGWTQSNVQVSGPGSWSLRFDPGLYTEKWNCGPYGPSGREMLFVGLAQDPATRCRGGPCDPIVALGTQFNFIQATLTTPPVELGEAEDPHLVLEHQMSHLVWACDGPFSSGRTMDSGGPCRTTDLGGLGIRTAARVTMDVYDPATQTWGNNVMLRPAEGYSSEASTGLQDPRYGSAGRRLLTTNDACNRAPVPQPLTVTTCGWWDPAGRMQSFRPADQTVALGGSFSGSPWRVDRFDLANAFHGPDGANVVDVRGQTVRFNLVFVRPWNEPPLDEPGHPRYDLGWRIGTVAVLDTGRFQRDVALTDVQVGTTQFDPAALGIGPDAELPVRVTVANEGRREARGVSVVVRAIDPTDPAAAPYCQAGPLEIPGILLPGSRTNVTLGCHVPDVTGRSLQLEAAVDSRDGDEFTGNDVLRATKAYEVRRSPDLAVRIDASPRVASQAASRDLFLTVENRGNVPVSQFELVREILQRNGNGPPAVLAEHGRRWAVGTAIPVGGQARLQDLEAEPAITPARDGTFAPPAIGTFDIITRLEAPGDIDVSNDQDRVVLRALREAYSESFDAPTVVDDAIVDGAWSAEAPWRLATEGDRHGMHLVAGDAAGEMPRNTDAVVSLPLFDLTPLQGATLTFQHRYDLENGFDAARLEASVAGGPWIPLTPRPQPLAGLPLGYSSGPVYGPNPLADGRPEAPAAAFTGASSQLPGGAADGYLTSEFDLASHPALRAPSQVERMRFDAFATHPNARPIPSRDGSTLQFRHPTWTMGEARDADHRSWWIDNVTQQPQPLSGDTMWWSGSAGEASPASPSRPICPALELPVPRATGPAGPQTLVSWWDWRTGGMEDDDRTGVGAHFSLQVRRPDQDADGLPDDVEALILTNPLLPDTDGDGWSDGAEQYIRLNLAGNGPTDAPNPTNGQQVPGDTDRDGLSNAWETWFLALWYGSPAGALGARPQDDLDMDGLTNLQEQTYYTHPVLADTDSDGLLDGEEVAYGSDPREATTSRVVERRADGWTRREAEVTAVRGADTRVAFTYSSRLQPNFNQPFTRANLGWFLDDAEIAVFDIDAATGARTRRADLLPLDTLEDRELDARTGQAGPWTTAPASASMCVGGTWTLVGGGASQRPGGWHVEHGVPVPGRGSMSVWRFAAPNDQGYPHLADARLVTPLVDLAQVVGSSAQLSFLHRYGFEAVPRVPVGDAGGSFLSAVDGGAVEYQVFDELTGTYGPWRQLFRGPDAAPDRLLLGSAAVPLAGRGSRIEPDRLALDNPVSGLPNRQKLSASGYTAVEERGDHYLSGLDPPEGGYGSVPPIPVDAGHGYSFQQFPGLVNTQQGPWVDFPVSYLFSGSSQGTEGWREEAWDVSHLLGQRVRFAFHAASNPSFTDPGNQGRLHGWSIAGLAVAGEVFDGKPMALRLRVATDGSMMAGTWDVDDLRLVGTPYSRNIALRTPLRDILVLPGTSVDIPVSIVNLGSSARGGLALAVVATSGSQVHDGVELVASPPLPEFEAARPGELADATLHGPFGLTPVGSTGSEIHATLRIHLPDAASTLRVQAVVLEETQAPAGAAVYRIPANQVSGGLAATWSVRGQVQQDLQAVPPQESRDALLTIEPGAPAPGDVVTFAAAMRNNGTTEPEVAARWRVAEVLRKGPDDGGPIGEEELGDWSATATIDLGRLHRGQLVQATFAPTPPPARNGLYRATVTFLADGEPAGTASTEFLVGPGGTYYAVDFADGALAGWADDGTSPGDLAWRVVDGRMIWGVTPAQLQAGTTYCRTPQARCMTQNANSQQNPIPSFVGMRGRAVSPLIDLGRVPQEQLFLTLQHGHGLETDDGGRIEALPLRTPVDPTNPQPAYQCGGQPAWFPLEPEPPGHGGLARSVAGRTGVQRVQGTNQPFTMPNRINPIAPVIASPVAVFAGPAVEQEVVRYDLSDPVPSPCGGPAVTLANHTVQLRFHVGTRPGTQGTGGSDIRRGALGWQVDGVRLSSAALTIAPAQRTVPILDGAPKQFTVDVTNAGPVHDSFTLTLDEEASTVLSPAWIQLPQEPIALAPGERRTVPFLVHVPADPGLARGTYAAVIAAASGRDSLVRQQARFDLALDGNPLPDLALQVNLEQSGAPPSFQAGTLTPVHTTVYNIGEVPSRATTLRLRALSQDGEYESIVGSATIPPLCPLAACEPAQARSTATFEWQVPDEVGLYEVVAEVDPEERLLEATRLNNVRLLVTRAVPLERPDLRITSLRVLGLGPDGYAEAGALVQVQANVTNVGLVPAEGAIVRLLAGSTELTEVTIPVLNPGQVRTVAAYRAASEGETLLAAMALLPSGLDADISNDQMTRLLVARSHDLELQAPTAAALVAAGGATTVRVLVENHGNALERLVLDLHGANATGWALAVQPNPLVVPPRGNATAVLTLQAPAQAVAGPRSLELRAQPAGIPGVHAATRLAMQVALQNGTPELTLDNATAPPGAARVPYRLDGAANQDRRLTLALRSPAWAASGQTVLVPAGRAVHGNLTVAVPADAAPGPRMVEVEVAEDGRALAVARATLTVAPAPALQAQWEAVRPGAAALGSREVLYDLKVTNAGNLPASVRAEVRDLADGQHAKGAASPGELAPGQSLVLRLAVRLRADAAADPAGVADVWMTPRGHAATLASSLELPDPSAAPNLVMERVDVHPRSGLVQGTSARIVMRVANHGTAPSPPTQLSAYADGVLLQDATVPPIEPGESADVELSWLAARPGTTLVTLFADGLQEVLESSEDDNGASLQVEVAKGGVDDRLRAVPLSPLWALAAVALAAAVARRRRA